MRIRDVIEGTWLVESQLMMGPSEVLGALTIEGAGYRFTPGSGARLPPENAAYVPFIERPSGSVEFFYGADVTAETRVDALPRPPLEGGYVQEIQIARVAFKDSKISTNHFRISLDLDGDTARFHPDFHATMFNNPSRVTRRIR